MKPKFKQKSPVDSIIIDMVLDHYNMQSMIGHPEILTGENFTDICNEAEKIYYQTILISETPGTA